MQPFTVSQHPNKNGKNPEGEELPLRDIDREELVQLLIGYGIEPIRVMGDDRQLVFWFIADEIELFENRYLSNMPIMVEYGMVTKARDYWRNAVTLWKSKLRLKQSS